MRRRVSLREIGPLTELRTRDSNRAAGVRVLLRADGGPSIGLGHVLRCLALAEGLRKAGFDTVCAFRAQGFKIADLGIDSEAVVSLAPSATLTEDLLQTLNIASENEVDWIVVDQCYPPISTSPDFGRYLKSLREEYRTLCIAGSEGIDYDADCVMSPYYGASYPAVPHGSTSEFLLGPEYFIFREEFRKASCGGSDTPRIARRILVTIGGSDEFGAT